MSNSSSLRSRLEITSPDEVVEIRQIALESIAALSSLERAIDEIQANQSHLEGARDHYKSIAMSLTGVRSKNEYRAQGVEVLKAKIGESMDRVAMQCNPKDWGYIKHVMLGIQDVCDLTAIEMREKRLPDDYWAMLKTSRSDYEKFIKETFGDTIDRSSANNGDQNYLAWDMLVGWCVWQHCMSTLRGALQKRSTALSDLLKHAAIDEIEMRKVGDTSDLWMNEASPENILTLIEMFTMG